MDFLIAGNPHPNTAPHPVQSLSYCHLRTVCAMRRLSQDARRGHKACGSRGALLPLGHRSGRMAFLVAIRTAPAGKISTSLPMITSHMKPYITSEQRPDGGRYLPLQLQRAELRKLAALLRGRRLLACKFPKMQTAGLAGDLDF